MITQDVEEKDIMQNDDVVENRIPLTEEGFYPLRSIRRLGKPLFNYEAFLSGSRN